MLRPSFRDIKDTPEYRSSLTDPTLQSSTACRGRSQSRTACSPMVSSKAVRELVRVGING